MLKKFSYTAIIERDEEGFFVISFPALPGCHTQGDTFEEAMGMAEDVLNLHLECMIELKEPIPEEVELVNVSTEIDPNEVKPQSPEDLERVREELEIDEDDDYEIGPGLLRKILRSAGIKKKEFFDATEEEDDEVDEVLGKCECVRDDKGQPTHVVLPLKRLARLIEDLHDLRVVKERENDELISWDEMMKKLDIDPEWLDTEGT